MVPNGWKILSLGEICNNNLQTGPFGSQLHAHEYIDAGISVVMPKDLINNRVNLESTAKIPKKRADDLKKHYLKSGDIIFSRRGDVSRFALIDDLSEGTICGTGCLKATPSPNHSSEFLSYFLQRDNVKQWLEQNAVGQTMLNINTEILSQLPLITASSIDEEKKIVTILSTWDKAIEATEKLINNSQAQKRALMQQLLTGKKRLLDENGNRFSGKWEKVLLKQLLVESTLRNKNSIIERVLSITNHSGFVLPEEQFSKRVASTNIENYKVVKKGQFGYNPSRINVGSFGRLDRYTDGILSPMYVIFNIDKNKLNSDYFLFWMESNEAHQRIKNSSQGSVRESVGFDALCAIPFHLPNLEEQKKISSVLSSTERELELLENKLEYLKQEKKALMQQLLTGKRRVIIN